jgi:hypothetical protein
MYAINMSESGEGQPMDPLLSIRAKRRAVIFSPVLAFLAGCVNKALPTPIGDINDLQIGKTDNLDLTRRAINLVADQIPDPDPRDFLAGMSLEEQRTMLIPWSKTELHIFQDDSPATAQIYYHDLFVRMSNSKIPIFQNVAKVMLPNAKGEVSNVRLHFKHFEGILDEVYGQCNMNTDQNSGEVAFDIDVNLNLWQQRPGGGYVNGMNDLQNSLMLYHELSHADGWQREINAWKQINGIGVGVAMTPDQKQALSKFVGLIADVGPTQEYALWKECELIDVFMAVNENLIKANGKPLNLNILIGEWYLKITDFYRRTRQKVQDNIKAGSLPAGFAGFRESNWKEYAFFKYAERQDPPTK